MPNTMKIKGVFIPGGDPDAMNVDALLHAGELGAEFDWMDRTYQVVKFDSSCSSVVAGMLAFWVDKALYSVTNVATSALGGGRQGAAYRNYVAGIFRCVATAGYYGCIVKQGYNISVADSSTSDGGDPLIAASSANADVVAVTMGTAPPCQLVGVAIAATDTGFVAANICINDTP